MRGSGAFGVQHLRARGKRELVLVANAVVLRKTGAVINSPEVVGNIYNNIINSFINKIAVDKKLVHRAEAAFQIIVVIVKGNAVDGRCLIPGAVAFFRLVVKRNTMVVSGKSRSKAARSYKQLVGLSWLYLYPVRGGRCRR